MRKQKIIKSILQNLIRLCFLLISNACLSQGDITEIEQFDKSNLDGKILWGKSRKTYIIYADVLDINSPIQLLGPNNVLIFANKINFNSDFTINVQNCPNGGCPQVELGYPLTTISNYDTKQLSVFKGQPYNDIPNYLYSGNIILSTRIANFPLSVNF